MSNAISLFHQTKSVSQTTTQTDLTCTPSTPIFNFDHASKLRFTIHLSDNNNTPSITPSQPRISNFTFPDSSSSHDQYTHNVILPLSLLLHQQIHFSELSDTICTCSEYSRSNARRITTPYLNLGYSYRLSVAVCFCHKKNYASRRRDRGVATFSGLFPAHLCGGINRLKIPVSEPFRRGGQGRDQLDEFGSNCLTRGMRVILEVWRVT